MGKLRKKTKNYHPCRRSAGVKLQFLLLEWDTLWFTVTRFLFSFDSPTVGEAMMASEEKSASAVRLGLLIGAGVWGLSIKGLGVQA